jgi:hypothetical protein
MRPARVAAWGILASSLLAGCSRGSEPSPLPGASAAAAAIPSAAPAPGARRPSAAGEAALEPAGLSPDWPSGRTCREIAGAVAALPEPARRRLDVRASPLAVAVVDRGARSPEATATEAVALDLPVPIDGGDGGDVPCLVVVERPTTTPAAPRRLVAHRVVRSTYRKGSQRKANPEHQALRRTVRELEDGGDAAGEGILATGDPSLDLIGLAASGVLAGIDLFRRGQAERQVNEALAATPPTVEHVAWEPYTYEVTTVEAERTGRSRMALVDRRLGRSWQATHEVLETRRFVVAAGRHAKDRDLLEGYGGNVVTAADVAVWEQAGLRPPLSALLATMASAAGEGTPGDLATIAAAWAATAPTATVMAPEPATAGRRGLSVEQTALADGTHRYRLVEPAAGERAEGATHGTRPLTAGP